MTLDIEAARTRQARLRDVFVSQYEYTQSSGNKLLALVEKHKPPFPIYHDTAGLFSSVMPIFKLAEESADAALGALDIIDAVLNLHSLRNVLVMAQSAPKGYEKWPTVSVEVCAQCIEQFEVDPDEHDESDIRAYLYPCPTRRLILSTERESQVASTEEPEL